MAISSSLELVFSFSDCLLLCLCEYISLNLQADLLTYLNIVKAKTTARMKIARKMKNKNLEISAERAAIEGNPNTPAMIAMIKKMNAHFNIFTP